MTRSVVLGSLTVSPDGTRLMACGTDRRAHVWEIATGKVLQSLPEHPAWVQGCCFLASGTVAATACRDGGLRVFAIDSGTLLARFVGHVGRVWSVIGEPAGTLLTAGADGTLRRWDPRSDPATAALRQIPIPDRKVTRVVPGRDVRARDVFAITKTGTVWHVDLVSGSARPLLPDARSVAAIDYDRSRHRLAVSGSTPGPVEVMDFTAATPGVAIPVPLPPTVSPKNALPCWTATDELVVFARDGNVFRCSRDLTRFAPLATLVNPVHAVAAAPAGPPRVAAAGRRTAIITLGANGSLPADPRFLEIGEDSSAVAWSPNGGTAAFGTRTGRVLLFDATTGNSRGALTTHEREVDGMAFTPDGRCLVTTDAACVRLSDVATLTTLDEFRPGWPVVAISMAPDGNSLTIAGGDGEKTPHAFARMAVLEFDRP